MLSVLIKRIVAIPYKGLPRKTHLHVIYRRPSKDTRPVSTLVTLASASELQHQPPPSILPLSSNFASFIFSRNSVIACADDVFGASSSAGSQSKSPISISGDPRALIKRSRSLAQRAQRDSILRVWKGWLWWPGHASVVEVEEEKVGAVGVASEEDLEGQDATRGPQMECPQVAKMKRR